MKFEEIEKGMILYDKDNHTDSNPSKALAFIDDIIDNIVYIKWDDDGTSFEWKEDQWDDYMQTQFILEEGWYIKNEIKEWLESDEI